MGMTAEQEQLICDIEDMLDDVWCRSYDHLREDQLRYIFRTLSYLQSVGNLLPSHSGRQTWGVGPARQDPTTVRPR